MSAPLKTVAYLCRRCGQECSPGRIYCDVRCRSAAMMHRGEVLEAATAAARLGRDKEACDLLRSLPLRTPNRVERAVSR